MIGPEWCGFTWAPKDARLYNRQICTRSRCSSRPRRWPANLFNTPATTYDLSFYDFFHIMTAFLSSSQVRLFRSLAYLSSSGIARSMCSQDQCTLPPSFSFPGHSLAKDLLRKCARGVHASEGRSRCAQPGTRPYILKWPSRVLIPCLVFHQYDLLLWRPVSLCVVYARRRAPCRTVAYIGRSGQIFAYTEKHPAGGNIAACAARRCLSYLQLRGCTSTLWSPCVHIRMMI